MIWKIISSILSIFLLLATLGPEQGLAQSYEDYPRRALDASVAFSPGGALDIIFRVMAQEMSISLNQPVIVRNTPGGGGASAVARLAASGADGYTLLACISNSLVFIPQRNAVPYRPLRDVVPIVSFGQAAPILIVNPDSSWITIDDFLAASRKASGGLRIGVPGFGSPSHIALAMMNSMDPTLQWKFVPYAGPGEAETALLGNHVDAAASGALARIQDGQFTPLLVLAGRALSGLPHIPALPDRGFANPGEGDSVFLLLAPAGMPEAVLNQLEAVCLQAAQSEAVQASMALFSVSPLIRGREETLTFLKQAWDAEVDILRSLGLGDEPLTAPL